MYFFVLVVFLLALCYTLFRSQKPRYKLPPALPGGLPLIGHTHLLIGDTAHLWRFVKKLQEHNLNNDGVTYLQIGTKRFYAVGTAEDCTKVASVCLEKNFLYKNIISSWVGEGLVTASVPVWKRHRRTLHPVFKQQILEGFIGIFNSHASLLSDSLSENAGCGPIDVGPYLDSAVLEAYFRIAFGAARNDKEIHKDQYLKAFREVTNILLQRFQHVWMHSKFIYSFTDLWKKEQEAVRTTSEVSNEIINIKKASNKASKNDAKSKPDIDGRFKGFLDHILESPENSLSEQEIREEIDTIVFAGYDSTATVLTYLLTALGSYPEVQERVYAELQDVFGGTNRDVEKEDLAKLVYLDAVVKETLRLYPIVPLIIRELDRDVQLRNYTLEAGSDCLLLIYATNGSTEWGEDREMYKPERWLDPSKLPENPSTFGSFGFGKRSCIGKVFAQMSIKIHLVHILRRYTVRGDITKLDMKLEILTKPIAGHYISLERRTA